jgi:Undecaprenyl-phosphate galactose phosphotransferase WbaP
LMSVQGSNEMEAVHLAARTLETTSRLSLFMGRWAKSGRQSLVASVLIASDILLALAIWQAAFVLQGVFWEQSSLSGLAVFGVVVPNVVVWVGLRAMLGIYPGYGLGQVEELRRQTLALLVTLAITGVFAFFSGVADSYMRVLLFAWSLGLLVLAPVARYFVKRAMMEVGLWGKPVLVLGAQQAGAHVLRVLQREWQLGLKPVAVFDNRVAPAGGVLEGVSYGGTLTDAVALARKHDIDTAIFAMPHTRREHLAKFVDLARLSFRHVMIIPNLNGVTNCTVVARDLAGTLGVEIRHNLLDPWAQRLKRVLDLMATAVGGLLILPLIVALSVLVRLESPGPVFYSDKRMGRDGRLFSCVKFRTMVLDAEGLLQQLLAEDDEAREEYLKYHKLRNDPRVTRVGRFLRRTSLDELPQLWNVLRGEMSLVGPRPYLPRESGDIGLAQSEILRVTPGITGPWQVTGRNNASFEDRLQMDVNYVRDWSVYLDLVLLARTVGSLLFSRGAY